MAIGSFGVTAIAEQDIAGAALHDLTHLFTRQNTLGKLRGALPVAKKDGLVGKREIGLGNLSKPAKSNPVLAVQKGPVRLAVAGFAKNLCGAGQFGI